jgi:hypothetical protein
MANLEPSIQTEFLNVLVPQVEEFFSELLKTDPSWLTESILEDETGDVYGELLSLLVDWLGQE